MKVERVSYPIPTPSAVRGILEAIFWKPEIVWVVRTIEILKPIKFVSLLRNEINSKQSASSAKGWQVSNDHFFADEDRAQRHTLALRDVDYVFHADMRLAPRATDDIAKYLDQFRRRVRRGQCFSIPYLGCREFSAYFEEPSQALTPIDLSSDLGRILWDIQYDEDGSGSGWPKFFEARIEKGILRIPEVLCAS